MKDFLNHIIDNNRYIQGQGKTPVSTEVIGDSGLGKTSIVLQVAEEHNLNFVKLNLAQIEEVGDLVGYPVRQFQMSKGETQPTTKLVKDPNTGKVTKVTSLSGTAQAEWIDENAVDQYAKQGYTFTGQKRMSYCPPEWIADKKGGGILILDDWNRADIRFIQAVMELVDRQEYISWKLPKDWHILLTANPDNGDYLVNTIDTAQRTRFVSVILKWNHERWAEWAERAGIDGRCINFVLMHPEIVNARVNPRSLTTFFNCISSYKDFNSHLPMIQMIGEGSVGPEASTLFTTFIGNNLDKMITPKEIMLSQDEKKIKDDLAKLFEIKDSYRADIASIMSLRIVNYCLTYAEKNPISEDFLKRLGMLIKNDDLFTDDLKFILVKRIIGGNKTKFQKLMIDTVVQDYLMK
jgi:hypothetical protein